MMDFSLRPSEPADEPFLWRPNQLAYHEVVLPQFGAWDPVKQKAFFDVCSTPPGAASYPKD